MKRTKRLLAFLLCCALLLPLLTVYGFAAEDEALSIDNGYIQVSVSTKNGGFLVNTVEGNLLRKSDNNKKLLFRSGRYDTSFVTFRVGSGEAARDYLFGGKYDGSGDVSVTKTAGGELVAVWSADGFTFTQTISLAEDSADEHGMISIGLTAKNGSGAAVPVQARILLDTCLGDRDWARYQFTDGSVTNTLDTEQVLTDAAVIRSFYAVDDLANPAVTAYAVSPSVPAKVAIGHWNNLAASLFDFVPDRTMNFTNYVNEYYTADSACALYYDLGTVAAGGSQTAAVYYGVYSNHRVKLDNSIAVNTVAPMRLTLNADRSAYERTTDVGRADFSVTVSGENYKSETSGDLSNVLLAVRSTGGLCALGDSGQPISGIDFDTADPLTVPYSVIREGATVTKTLYFKAMSVNSASYERITVGFYSGEVTEENLLGEKNVYILLPGGDGGIPQVCFNSMTPDTVYNEGTRHLYLAVTNAALLNDSLKAGNCVFKVYGADGKKSLTIPSDGISINESEGVADIALTDDLTLAVGSWKLQLEWSDAAVSSGVVAPEHQKQTADMLRFAVSDDPKYRNDTYGVLAAVKYGKGTGQYPYYYRLVSFPDEERYKAFAGEKEPDWTEILLVFRGAFTMDKRYTVKDENGTRGFYYSAVSKKTVDPATRENTVTNRVTINNCVDFEGGTIAVYYEDYANKNANSSILVEIDGELYTSTERTSVWTGQAALTKLEQGRNFSLVQYTSDGVRKSSSATPITLIWPNVFGLAQTLSGMAFKLAYGQFGIMDRGPKDPDRVISFAASMSLSFLRSPEGDKTDYGTASYFGRMQELWKDWRGASIYQYAYHGNRYEKLTNISMNDTDKSSETQQGVQTSVMIPDILFGKDGFVGLNFTVDVTVRNLVDSLAKIEAALSVNTMGNWSFGMEGTCALVDDISMEAKLKFKSYNDIPVPDELYFYVGGFKPGLCIDPCGVVWITGAGGGFSGLYDTIFYTGGIPPLKLVMTMGFAALQILEGTAKMEVSGSGVSITASKLKIKDAIEVVRKIQVSLQWYPDFKLSGAVYISMFERCIEGQGYMIVVGEEYSDWFFEMFIRAALKVPASVPVVGGVTVAGVDLGVSTEKIWGALEALGVVVGVTYYWGEDSVDFGSGSKAHPTYPGLLLEGYDGEYEDFPVAYDEETGRTLYARFGTNFEAPVAAQVLSEGDLVLQDAAGVYSDVARQNHKLSLGVYDPDANASAVVQINYAAESLEAAKALAETFTVTDAPKGAGSALPLTVYDGSNLETANANATWNEETGMACFAFTVTDAAHYGKNWYVSTGETAADLVLYNVLPLPEVTGVSAPASVNAGGSAAVTWTGSGLDELDSISFFLTSGEDPAEDAGYPLGSAVTEGIASGAASLKVPANVPAGEYLLRAVYSKDDQLNGVIHGKAPVTVVNADTPAPVDSVSVSPAGDLRLGVTVRQNAADPNTTGYYVTVYNEDGSPTQVAGMAFDRAASGDTFLEIGGSYVSPVRADPDDPDSPVTGTETIGLTGGTKYLVGVTPYKLAGGETVVFGEEVTSAAVTLPTAVTPTAVLTAEGRTLTAVKDMAEGASSPVFTVNGLTVEAAFSEAVTGTWTLDNTDIWAAADGSDGTAVSGSFSAAGSTVIRLDDLAEGSHVLNISGRAADGDGFACAYPFTVDTAAPRLVIGSPLNGSFFGAGGELTVTGLTDPNARLTVAVDGNTVAGPATVEAAGGTLDGDGVFSLSVSIPDHNGAATHTVTIFAADENGNRTETHSILVAHPGLGDLAELVIMADKAEPADGNVSTESAGSVQLRVLGVTGEASGSTRFVLDPAAIRWNGMAAEGSLTVSPEGVLSYDAYTKGFVEAMVEVTEGAYRTAALSLGAEPARGYVSVSSTIGGSASGTGYYTEKDTVTLTAEADYSYEFDHWELTGVTVADAAAETVTFPMPAGNVEAVAHFRAVFLPGDLNGDGSVNTLDLIRLKKYLLGENVTLEAPGDLNGDGAINPLDLIRLKKYVLNEGVVLY